MDWVAPPSPPLTLHSSVLGGPGLQWDAPQPQVALNARHVLHPVGDGMLARQGNARQDAVLQGIRQPHAAVRRGDHGHPGFHQKPRARDEELDALRFDEQ